MNTVGMLLLATCLWCVLFQSRRSALAAVVLGVLFLTQGQSVDVLGINLYAFRFLELAGLLRVVARGEFSWSRTNRIDYLVIILNVFAVIVYLIRSESPAAAVAARGIDSLLTYFTLRGLLLTSQDLKWLLQLLAVALVPYVLILAYESFREINLFAVIGANREESTYRAGRIRCIGSFRHPTLLGSVGATFFPLYVALFWEIGRRKLAICGALLCTAIVGFSNSGGPLGAWGIGIIAWCFWALRTRMKAVRIAMVVGFVALAAVMKAPVYYIIARFSSVTGGGGWHRSRLIELAMRDLEKWWLAGMAPSETSEWFPYTLSSGNADITNQFIAFGIQAGLGAIILFVLLLWRVYQSLGNSLAHFREQKDMSAEALVWGLGATVTVHIVNWFGITYFDQFNAFWMLHLAAISCFGAQRGHDSDAEDLSKVSSEQRLFDTRSVEAV